MAWDANHLLAALLRGTLILSLAAVIVMALLGLLRLRSAKVRWRAWFAVLLCGCGIAPFTLRVPWLAESPLMASAGPTPIHMDSPAENKLDTQLETDAELGEVDDFATPDEALNLEVETPATQEKVDALGANSPTASRATANANDRPPATPAEPFPWRAVVLGIWLLGIALIFLRGVWRYLRFLRILRGSQAAPGEWSTTWDALLASRQVREAIPFLVSQNYGPALCRLPTGYALVVPRGMWAAAPEAARDIILRHELAHYQRRDLLWSLAARWLAAPHWFNPLAHLAVRKLDEAAEWACDDDATGGQAERRLALSKTLLSFSEADSSTAMQAAVGSPGLAARIRRLLEPNRPQERMMKRMLLGTALIACLVAGGVRLELVAQEAAIAEPTPTAAIPPPVRPSVPPIAKAKLRYDGKTFAEWRDAIQVELKPDRRLEGLKAIVEFAHHGYEAESANLLVALLREQRDSPPSQLRFNNDPDPAAQFPWALTEALRSIDSQYTSALLWQTVMDAQSGHQMYLAIQSLGQGATSPPEGYRQHMLEIGQDRSRSWEIRGSALNYCRPVNNEPDPQAWLAAERAVIADSPDPKSSLFNVLGLVVQGADANRIGQRDYRVQPSVEAYMVPLLVDGLRSNDKDTRKLATKYIGTIGEHLLPILPEVLQVAQEAEIENGAAAREALRIHFYWTPQVLQEASWNLEGEDRNLVLSPIENMHDPERFTAEERATMLAFFQKMQDDPNAAYKRIGEVGAERLQRFEKQLNNEANSPSAE